MHDATDDAPIVCPLDASHIRRQMRLNPLPLLIAQPKQVLPHGPDPPKRIKYIWNQDCFAVAAKLMSSHPSLLPGAKLRIAALWPVDPDNANPAGATGGGISSLMAVGMV
jgi:hypothetical protein